MGSISYILVTGATGLVGAHVVGNLLSKGFRVRGVARSKSKAKADALLAAMRQRASRLDFFFIEDLTDPTAFDEAVKDIDGVIHLASPLKYTAENNEKDIIIPAVQGVRSILEASLGSSIKRVVLTSSFGAVLDMGRPESTPWTYSSQDWNPITYAEASASDATAQDAYRGSKTFAEQAAWQFIEERKPAFDLVTLCPSMVFGPQAVAPQSAHELNESNMNLLTLVAPADSAPATLSPCRFNFWIDVRDLAEIHVLALTTPAAGGKRYVPVAPEPFTYQKAAETVQVGFPELASRVARGTQEIKSHVRVNSGPMERDFPCVRYTPFHQTVVDFWNQLHSFV
ncbi:dihydroflavonol-4-reductase [Nemania sp. FL0031]|nr:dihydroflavonol-4-reductase [Nemania sp. FL0031]